MNRDLLLGDEEVSLVRLLVEKELETNRFEAYHTDDLDYREIIRGRIDRCQMLLRKINGPVRLAVGS